MKAVVIGGGVIGLCSAYELNQRGWDVMVVDAHAIAKGGCSTGNAGLIVPSHFIPLASPGMVQLGLKMAINPKSPFGCSAKMDFELLRWAGLFSRHCNSRHVANSATCILDLNLKSRELYRGYAELWDFDFAQRGLMMVCEGRAALDHEVAAAAHARKLGLKVTIHDQASLRQIEPAIEFRARGGVQFHDDGQIDPARFMTGLKELLTARGVNLAEGNPVLDFEVSDDRIISAKTAGVDLGADTFVLAAGSWSGQVSGRLELDMPLQPGKGYSFTANRLQARLHHPTILTEARIALTPLGSGLRFAGTMEIGDWDAGISTSRVEGITESIRRVLPAFADLEQVPRQVWVGHRPCTPDGLPYIGFARRWKNLVVATGHAMMGMSLGPITGQMVAELASHQSTTLTALSPDRFQG